MYERTRSLAAWDQLVKDTLKELGATKSMVPGSRLRLALNEKDRALVDKSVAEVFPQNFVSAIERVSGVSVIRRPGTDVLVGLEGATPGANPVGPRLRSDVYLAFTRMSEKPYIYIRDQDLFTNEYLDSSEGVVVPSVSLTKLMDERREFAKQLGDEEKTSALITTIDSSANPLFAFQRKLSELRLGGAWHRHHLVELVRQIEAWASAEGVTAQPSWFQEPSPAEPPDARYTPQDILARLARFMSDTDIRSLTIPFAAVEAMYAELASKIESDEEPSASDTRGNA